MAAYGSLLLMTAALAPEPVHQPAHAQVDAARRLRWRVLVGTAPSGRVERA